MRELTEFEKAALAKDFDGDPEFRLQDNDGEVKIVKRELSRRTREVSKHFWQKLTFWAGVSITIPLTLVAIFMFAIWRVESVLGPGTLEYLSKQNMGPKVQAAATEAGFGWLPMVVEVYSMRAYIIVTVMLIGLFISGTLIAIDMGRTRKKQAKLQEEITRELRKEKDRDRRAGILDDDELLKMEEEYLKNNDGEVSLIDNDDVTNDEEDEANGKD